MWKQKSLSIGRRVSLINSILSLILSGSTLPLYFSLSHTHTLFSLYLSLVEDGMGLDMDALDNVGKEEGTVTESDDNGDLDVEVDVVGQWGSFLPFSCAFPIHSCGIVGNAKCRNNGWWRATGFRFSVSK